jgi:integrase
MALRLLDRFLLKESVASLDAITPVVIDSFLASRPRHQPQSYNHLLGTVSRVFDWLAARDLAPPSPVRATRRRGTRSRLPFLLDADAAQRLLQAAGDLPDVASTPLRPQVYRTIFALLYGLGMRVGEVARLRIGDIDPARQLLVVRQAKFGKSRLVPFGPRMGQLIVGYLNLLDRHRGPLSPSTPLFSFRNANPIHPATISHTFQELIPQLGLEIPDGTARPCVHCLRHSFAVGTLLRWYRSGVDPGARLLQLSTFLGHVNPASTSVYLTVTTELLSEANQRFERWAAPLVQEVLS